MSQAFADIDGDSATSKVLSSSFFTIGIDRIIGNKKGFINFTEELLLKIARENKLVMENPGPSVYFAGFGADSLDFMLRAYVSLSDAVKVQNQIRHRINEMFQEAGIEIPFAQRDAHLDTSAGPLDIRLLNEKPEERPEPVKK